MKISRVAVVPALALVVACAQVPDAAPGTVAFTDVTVIPMDTDGVLEHQTVVVEGGTITRVGPADGVVVGRGATMIDGAGRYLMPGLAEMHAHVPPVEDPPRQQLEDIFFLYIANGVTSIRGMLGSAYQVPLAEEIRRGDWLAPTFYVGAPSINGNSAPNPEAAEALVRANQAAGYHLQKIHPGVSLETWDRMVEVAREVGITFGGHVPADVGLRHALRTGMSTVDHMDGYVIAVASDAVAERGPVNELTAAADPDEARIREVVDLSAETGVYVVPTSYLWRNLYGNPDVDAVLSLPEMRYVSARQREAWRRQAGGPPTPPETAAAHDALRLRLLAELANAGVPILMGTDSPQLFNVPGFALHREIAVMAESGMTNRQILESGTINVGRYVREQLGIDDRFGAVAAGQRADLVLLGSNPLDDLGNLTDRVGVMVRGRWVPREEIDAGLAGLAARNAEGEA